MERKGKRGKEVECKKLNGKGEQEKKIRAAEKHSVLTNRGKSWPNG